MLSQDQYQWEINNDQNGISKVNLGNGRYGDLRSALDRPDNPIKDIYNDEGTRIGAYNTETGYMYGLQSTNKESSTIPSKSPFDPVTIPLNNNPGDRSIIEPLLKQNQQNINTPNPSQTTESMVTNGQNQKYKLTNPVYLTDKDRKAPDEMSHGAEKGWTWGLGLAGGVVGVAPGAILSTVNPIAGYPLMAGGGLATMLSAGLVGQNIGREIDYYNHANREDEYNRKQKQLNTVP